MTTAIKTICAGCGCVLTDENGVRLHDGYFDGSIPLPTKDTTFAWCADCYARRVQYRPLTKERAAEMDFTYHVQRTDQEPIEVTLEEYVSHVGGVSPLPRFFMTPGMQCWIAGPDERKLV